LEEKMKLQPRINHVVYLLARIGADEKVEAPKIKYDLGKLRQIVDLYCELGFPPEAMKVLELMEQIAKTELTEPHAIIREAKANVLFAAFHPSRNDRLDQWAVMWNEVWTYDKVVAVHKEAIEWGKKAKWPEDRIKKLEDQITKLPDLLKYVKEPKNWKDLLEGKDKEPKW